MKLLKHTVLPEFSQQEQKALYILTVIVFISHLALAFRPLWQLATRPFIDDAFYVFTISKNIAAGNGITIDGTHLTNGFQPLITFLYVPIFWIANSDTVALRLVFIIIAITDSVTILFLAKLIRSIQKKPASVSMPMALRPPMFAALCWGLLHTVTLHTMNGLETGLYALLIIANTYTYYRLSHQAKPSLSSWIGFGVLLGITILTRIDSVFLVISIGIVEIYRQGRKGIRSAMVIAITAFLISTPWWTYNYFVFGSIMPQSGQAESIGNSIGMNLGFAATDLASISTVAFFFSPYGANSWAQYGWFLLMLSIIVIIVSKLHALRYLKTEIDSSSILPLLLFAVAIIGFYTFLFRAPYFLSRYFMPFRIFWIILIASLMPLLYQQYKSYLRIRKQLLTLCIGIIGCAAITFNGYGYIHHFFSKPAFLYQAAEWAQQHPNARIGMAQTGITGFFSSNVTNLDGKVNIDALRSMQHSEIGEYVKEKEFDYIADIIINSGPITGSAAKFGANYERVDSVDEIIIFKKKN
jgi:hypothetical protein